MGLQYNNSVSTDLSITEMISTNRPFWTSILIQRPNTNTILKKYLPINPLPANRSPSRIHLIPIVLNQPHIRVRVFIPIISIPISILPHETTIPPSPLPTQPQLLSLAAAAGPHNAVSPDAEPPPILTTKLAITTLTSSIPLNLATRSTINPAPTGILPSSRFFIIISTKPGTNASAGAPVRLSGTTISICTEPCAGYVCGVRRDDGLVARFVREWDLTERRAVVRSLDVDSGDV